MFYAGEHDVAVQVFIKHIPDEHEPYFDSCARLRDISKTALLARLIDVIGRDQLVLSILDDDSKPLSKRKGEHRYRPNGANGSGA